MQCNARDPGSIPGSGRLPGGENGNPLQYSCLEISMERAAWCYSPWGRKELDTTQWPTQTRNSVKQFAFILYSISYSLESSVPSVSTTFVFLTRSINAANELLISCQFLYNLEGLFKGIYASMISSICFTCP